MASNNTVLTVVVLDEKSAPAVGEEVHISPLDLSKITDSNGEVRFTLGDANAYQITAASGENKVTVPYYVTPNGATRMVVNPKYVKTVEARLHPWYKSGIATGLMAVLILALLFYLISKIWPKNRRG